MAIIQKSENLFCVFIKGLYFFYFSFPEAKLFCQIISLFSI